MTAIEKTDKTARIGRWYFGGFASAGAACCTHPLDLLKVHLQTQQQGKFGVGSMAVHIVRSQGILALYNGLSASITRQLTYSLTRFAIYETVKKHANDAGHILPFYQKILLASVAGSIGGFVGTPPDLVNVRMQNDIKLPVEKRRNYKHAVDGMYRVYAEEGFMKMYSGASMASSRAVLVTVGQLACYDQLKMLLLRTSLFKDNLVTHFSASIMAGVITTFITMPLDVMKTRVMNAKPGAYSSLLSCFMDIAKIGPLGFFKGFVPAFIRLGPQTVLTFILFEQFRMNFGYIPVK